MERAPRYSIIVPVHNCNEYLFSCVKSIMLQSYSGFELLLVDDGSTDGSEETCDVLVQREVPSTDTAVCFELKDEPSDYRLLDNVEIRVFHKQNGGAASARNVGIENARGEWLLFVDGDDTIEPDCLATINTALANVQEGEVDAAVFGMAFDYYSEKGLSRTDVLSCKHEGIFSVEKMVEEFDVLFSDNALSSSCNRVFRRNIVLENNLRYNESMNLYEDFDFVLRYMACSSGWIFSPQVLYRYRHDGKTDHGANRFSSLGGIKTNAECVIESADRLMDKYVDGRQAIATVLVNLYVDLFSMHCMDYCKELELGAVSDYFNSDAFCRLISYGAVLNKRNRYLVECAQSGNDQALMAYFTKQKRKCMLKKTVKKLLGKA